MKIFSWNVNGIRAVEKKGALADFLARKNPDIVCFQEIKIDAEQIAKENFDEKYPEYLKFWSHAERKGYAGTAIWSKVAPKTVLTNFPEAILAKYNLHDNFGDAASEGRICAAEFDDFWLLTVYTPNTKNDLGRLKLRQEWDAAFLELAKGLEQGEFSAPKPVFFCGDLNVAHQEIDLTNPKANRGKHGFTDEERAGFSNFLSANFHDIFREQHPDEPELYTWWSHFAKSRERNVGWRIDYFLISGNGAENDKMFASSSHKAHSAKISDGNFVGSEREAQHGGIFTQKIHAEIHPEILGSDHCPVSIELISSEKTEVKNVWLLAGSIWKIAFSRNWME